MNEEINTLLEQIKNHYQFQNDEELKALLEGLADTESKGVTYWDYIEVDTLLSLQKTKTNYPDEVIFIAYHQIHELYFKLIIQELEKITRPERFKAAFILGDEAERWRTGLQRVVRYMNKLIGSIDILKCSFDTNEFGKFRKSLLPASGFQTHQFRLIEIMLTSFEHLIGSSKKEKLTHNLTMKRHFKHIYWRSAVMTGKGKPAKILENFNSKYDKLFKEQLKTFSKCNLYFKYLKASENFRNEVRDAMMEVDKSILIWKIVHLKTVKRHIPSHITGTGLGVIHWSEYLEVRNQKIYYFPVFWEELDTCEKLDEKIKEIEEKYPGRIMHELKEIWEDVQA